MNHVNDGILQAYLDGEIAGDARAEVGRHLAACEGCAGRLEELREWSNRWSTLLRSTDRPARTDAARAEVLRRHRRTTRVRRSRRMLRAAALVVGLVGLGAAALPGSPVFDWLAAAWPGEGAQVPDERAVASAEPAGVSIVPVDGRARVSVEDAAAGTRIRVRLVNGPRVRVTVTGDPAGVQFRTGSGRISIAGAGPGTVTLELPRTLRHGRVDVDDRPILVKEDDDLRFVSTPTDTTGAEIVFGL